MLVDDLELLEETPFILTLDDYHLVRNPSIDSLLAEMLRYAPLSLHLILSARRSLSLSLSWLKLQEGIVEIKTADLRFTNAETLVYFQQRIQVPLSKATINQLQEKTEGWAAGLALAAISLREEAQPDDLIARLEESDRHMSDYLMDEVFSHQPDEIRQFLLKTAAFSQFCASMLHEVFDSTQSENQIQALLENIEDTQFFLIPLDVTRTWYRYHHLFRQMLLSRQRFHFHADQTVLYHRKAAAWLVRNGWAGSGKPG